MQILVLLSLAEPFCHKSAGLQTQLWQSLIFQINNCEIYKLT